MNNIIVRETASEMRAIARNTLKGSWKAVFIGMLVYYILSSLMPLLLNEVIPNPFPTHYNELLEANVGPTIGDLYNLVLTGAFSVGLCSFMPAFFRNKDIHPGYLFNGFEYFVKTFCLMFVMSVFIFLWTLCLIVPGIIAGIRYSQAFYILADDPDKGVMQCIRESKEMMAGNKGRYFYTSLTFIGWAILASLLSGAGMMVDGVVGILLSLICDIPLIFLLVYVHTTLTVFYDLAGGKLVAKPQPDFVEEDYHF